MLSATNHSGVQTNTLEKLQGATAVFLDDRSQLAQCAESNWNPSLLIALVFILFRDVVEVDFVAFGVKDLDCLRGGSLALFPSTF